MAAIDQDFELYQGDTADVTITVRVPSTGTPKDISGSAVAWKAVRQATCEEIAKVTPAGIDMTDAANGVIKLHFTHEETKEYRPGRYDHVATVTDQAGDACTVTVGVLTIKSLF